MNKTMNIHNGSESIPMRLVDNGDGTWSFAMALGADADDPVAVRSVGAGESVSATISAQNTFTDWIEIGPGEFDLSLSGFGMATVHVQRTPDDGATILDVDSFTANTEQIGVAGSGGYQYRAGIKTGNYTSGSIVVRISQ